MSHYAKQAREERKNAAAEIRLWLAAMTERMSLEDLFYLRKVVNDLEEYKGFEKFIEKMVKGEK